MNGKQTLDISWETIAKILATAFFIYLIYLIKDMILWILFAFVISILAEPAVSFLEKKRLSRTFSVILIYLVFFGFISFLIYLIVPFFIQEIQQFSQLFPQYFERFSPVFRNLGLAAFENLESFTKSIQEWLIKASSSIFSAVVSIFGGIIAAFTIVILSVFFSIEKGGLEKAVKLVSPKGYEQYFLELFENSQKKISIWFGVRILGCLFVGLLVFLTCYIFQLKYALTFGIIAGVLDIIPVVGPTVAGAIVVAFAFLESWPKALFLLIAFVLIQQIEGNVLVPILTRKFVGLSPILVLISLIIGGKLWGILGAVLTIPLVGSVYEFIKDYLQKKKEGRPLVL